MQKIISSTACAVFLSAAFAFAGIPAAAPEETSAHSAPGDNTEELAKAAQNPVGDLISLPVQWNMGFGAGPTKTYQSTLNIQPVIPITLNEDWNIITRTILPINSWPTAGENHVAGLGDTVFTAFLSPSKVGKFIWGVGPAALLPTATNPALGSGQWGIGPSLVGLYMGKHIVAGAVVSNIWSLGGWTDTKVNLMTLQPFLNYNFSGGWYLTSSPILTANWAAPSSGDVWTVPIGGGFGKIVHLGKLPVNVSVQAFYNIATPEYGADWSLRLQCQLLFPK